MNPSPFGTSVKPVNREYKKTRVGNRPIAQGEYRRCGIEGMNAAGDGNFGFKWEKACRF